ncbi:MAG: M28 family peptidase [Elusimicrobiales bacterium]|nr:M28 family peptidase [Elusimicrobiales bacterium]
MLTKRRLLQLFGIAAACAAGLALSMLGWNMFAPAYTGGPTLTGQAELKAAVTTLSVDIGPRDLYNNNLPRLRRAEDYITARFKAAGCAVEVQEYLASGVKVKNISCVKTGASAPGEVIVVGAHYDTFNNPGADDNASGTAGVLALADYAKGRTYARTVKFAAFVNEEPPFFRGEGMGSKIYADAAAARGEDIRAALVLEMIGYFSEARFSQRYPPLVGVFLPDRGNFIAQVSNIASRELAGRADRAFRGASDLPLATVSLPSFVRGADFSDHRSFWAHGWPAVMFTDTSFYRTPHYHKATDLPATLNFEHMAAFLDGMRAVLDDLAG